MSYPGFYLTSLTLKGPGVPDAEVRFRTGLNVIFGASDTNHLTYLARPINLGKITFTSFDNHNLFPFETDLVNFIAITES